MNNFALYEITDNGLSFISKHVSYVAAMIQSTVHANRPSCEWEHFQSTTQETWVSNTFCIVKEGN